MTGCPGEPGRRRTRHVRCPERTRTVALFWSIVSSVLLVFLILLFARFVVDWVMVLARSWHPSGLVAAGLEVVYTTTDPPLKAVRKVIPPLNLGSIRLDLGFMVLLIAVLLLRSFATRLAIAAA